VGTLNRTGYRYVGHFDVALKNRIASLLDSLIACDTFNEERPVGRGGWVNGNDYDNAGETFGIMQLDPEARETYGMLPNIPQSARETKVRHQWLAERQGTMFAITPVHTREERDIFTLLMESSRAFSNKSQPDWTRLASEWSSHCNGKTVFYKVTCQSHCTVHLHSHIVHTQLPQHLRSYFKVWNDFCNENNTIAANNEASERIRALLQPQPCKVPTIISTRPDPLENTVNAPQSVPQPEMNAWQLSKILGDHRLQQSTLQMMYQGTANPNHVPPPKRPALETVQDRPSKRQRVLVNSSRPRHCRYCHSAECSGRWKIDRCPLRVAHMVGKCCLACVLNPLTGTQSGSNQGAGPSNLQFA